MRSVLMHYTACERDYSDKYFSLPAHITIEAVVNDSDCPTWRSLDEGSFDQVIKVRSDDVITVYSESEELMISAALRGYSNSKLLEIHQRLLTKPSYEVRKEFYLRKLPCKVIHLQNVLSQSVRRPLDVIAARLGYLSDDCAPSYIEDACARGLLLRQRLSQLFDIECVDLSAPDIAEAVMRKESERLTGSRAKASVSPSSVYRFSTPSGVFFSGLQMQMILKALQAEEFRFINGELQAPENWWLKIARIHLGNSSFKMSLGGLHSDHAEPGKVKHRKPCGTWQSDENNLIREIDVASYYPSLIVNSGLYPQALGESFRGVFSDLLARRLSAKAAGDRNTSDAMKLILNSCYGKFGQKTSILFAPEMRLAVCLTGQVYMLMLIERLTDLGCEVICADTDGIIVQIPRARVAHCDEVVAQWSSSTALSTESSDLRSAHIKSTADRILVKSNGNLTRKGDFGRASIDRNPAFDVVSDAVSAYLTDGTPIEKTVYECDDMLSFCQLAAVSGVYVESMGRTTQAALFYRAKQASGSLKDVSDRTVPGSFGCRLICSTATPASAFNDLDRDHYIKLAKDVIQAYRFESAAQELFA